MHDPLAGSAWSAPSTVRGFSESPPNTTLLGLASSELAAGRGRRALDIGCGAARNAVHLARQGWAVLGTDLSMPMLAAARLRASEEMQRTPLRFTLAAMDALPVVDRSCDLVVAHGIWNLARSAGEFRSAVADAARAARPGAALFVFTFSRHTLPADAAPVAGEPFVFTQFSGQPQCFLTREQLLEELGRVGFVLDEGVVPLREHNLPAPNAVQPMRGPVIFEAVFRAVDARAGASESAEQP